MGQSVRAGDPRRPSRGDAGDAGTSCSLCCESTKIYTAVTKVSTAFGSHADAGCSNQQFLAHHAKTAFKWNNQPATNKQEKAGHLSAWRVVAARAVPRTPTTGALTPKAVAMAAYPSGMDSLAQREALLLRLNDELDADARTAISDAERYLRDPPVPPATSHNKSALPRTANPAATRVISGLASGSSGASGTAATRANNRMNRCHSTATQLGSRTAKGGFDATSRGGTEARSIGVAGRGSGLINGHGKVARRADGVSSDGARASPLFRLSERVREEAKASGERNRRRNAGAATARAASAGSLSPSHGNEERARQDHGNRPDSGSREQGVSREALLVDGEGDTDGATDASGVPQGIGDEATARFLKAKLAACQAQLEEALQAHKASQQEAVELKRQSASDQEQARRVSRQLQQLQQGKEKESKAKEEEAASSATLSARVGELERNLAASRKAGKQMETEKKNTLNWSRPALGRCIDKSLEVRLHRAQEEVSRQKEAIRQTRWQSKDLGQGQRQEVVRLEGKCQRLERQKLELLSAFKKQLKLIDVLKRQKFHVEASRVLEFTEEDFIKTLDWDSNGRG